MTNIGLLYCRMTVSFTKILQDTLDINKEITTGNYQNDHIIPVACIPYIQHKHTQVTETQVKD